MSVEQAFSGIALLVDALLIVRVSLLSGIAVYLISRGDPGDVQVFAATGAIVAVLFCGMLRIQSTSVRSADLTGRGGVRSAIIVKMVPRENCELIFRAKASTSRKRKTRLRSSLGTCANVPGQSDLTSVSVASEITDGHSAATPPGFVTLCMHHAEVCAGNTEVLPNKVVLNDQNRGVLTSINDAVNRSIAYREDRQNFGVVNVWNLNAMGGTGDCKDYALAKQQALIAAGLPRESLRLAIVKTPRDELHAVLTVDTDKGDFVLDSINQRILPWSETSYSWLSRQSAANPLEWRTIAANY
jgi:predicted transglutaminase-like cysteine proteinase